MGTLLDFSSAPRPMSRLKRVASEKRGSARSAKGEVILFPGVRYEREGLDLAARIGTIGRSAGTTATECD
ncbi:hypothetical protein [Roseibium sp.]|uniref:hypothetical protein n=1 Tax=Roseibium sp. TaxID=1936156 RepID=UPI003A970208